MWLLFSSIKIINHSLSPHIVTHIDMWKVLSLLSPHACWMRLVKESLHDVIHNVWNSYRSVVKLILQLPGVKSEKTARGATSPLFYSRLSVLVLFSVPALEL